MFLYHNDTDRKLELSRMKHIITLSSMVIISGTLMPCRMLGTLYVVAVGRYHVLVSPEATNEGEVDTRIQHAKLGGESNVPSRCHERNMAVLYSSYMRFV